MTTPSRMEGCGRGGAAAGLAAVALLAGCGGGGSELACVDMPPSEMADAAEVVFEGRVLASPTADDGLVTSPARLEVTSWRKGEGPPIVEVNTGVSEGVGTVSYDTEGITPRIGERWLIYGDVVDGDTIATSVCAGSRQR